MNGSATKTLRLLSYNIQAGIHTESFRHYVTRGWQHLLPRGQGPDHLDRIATAISGFDVVALQEIDSGSLRNGFVNQVEYLANNAEYAYWYAQRNRNLGFLAQSGNGLLTREMPLAMEDHKLPGRIPGRGAILCRMPCGPVSVCMIAVHLSLGKRDQAMQLSYIRELIEDDQHVMLVGDMNMSVKRLLSQSPLRHTDLQAAGTSDLRTYPSWRPFRSLDHVLVSSRLKVKHIETLDCTLSDHLPLSVEIEVPTERPAKISCIVRR